MSDREAEKTDEFGRIFERFPSWTKDDYNIYWRLPEIYKRHADKIWGCSKLIEQIIERSKLVLNSGQFDIREVDLSFDSRGVTISVLPGTNGCMVYPSPDGRSYSCHNIDSPNQCFSLYFLLVTALNEIFQWIARWEEDPGAGLTEDVEKTYFRLERSLESKDFRLFEIKDWDLETAGVSFARTTEEAEKVAKNVLGEDECQSAMSMLGNPCFLSSFLIFEVEVSFEENFPSKTFEVIAESKFDVERMVKKEMENQPAFWPVKKIKVLSEKGKPILTKILEKG